jgi:hypothetical protein
MTLRRVLAGTGVASAADDIPQLGLSRTPNGLCSRPVIYFSNALR